jgi:hypothetical protein
LVEGCEFVIGCRTVKVTGRAGPASVRMTIDDVAALDLASEGRKDRTMACIWS